MFNNPIFDERLQPDQNDLVTKDGMKKCEQKQVFLEADWKNPYILHKEDYNSLPELLKAYENWWIRKRHMPNTVKKHVSAIKRMNQHPIYPINPWDLETQQIINYLEYREHIEKTGPYGIINDWKALKSLASSYGINLDEIGYIPPSPPPAKTRIIPLPELVKKQINHKYSKNKIINKTIQYLLLHGYMFGYRPTEFPLQLINNLKINDGYIIIIESKKHYQLRQLFPEKELLTSDRRKSIKNLLKLHDIINPDNPHLYIQPNGKSWTVNYLRKWLCSYVQPVFPDFSMYNMRHWCAIARLIKSYKENHNWDKEDVKNWLGHDDLRTTDEYTQYAKKYYRLAPFDWISAVLKANPFICQKNSIDRKQPQTLNTSNQTTGKEKSGPTGIQTSFLHMKSLKNQLLSFFFSLDYNNNIFYFLVSPIFIQQGVGDKKFGDKKRTTAFLARSLQHPFGEYNPYTFLKFLCFLSLRFCCPSPQNNNVIGCDNFGTKNN